MTPLHRLERWPTTVPCRRRHWLPILVPMTAVRSSRLCACCSRCTTSTVVAAATPAEALTIADAPADRRGARRPELREGPHERRAGARAGRRRWSRRQSRDAPGGRHDRVELDRPDAARPAARRPRLHREAVGRIAARRLLVLARLELRPRRCGASNELESEVRQLQLGAPRCPTAPSRSDSRRRCPTCGCSKSKASSCAGRWNSIAATSAARRGRSGSAGRRSIDGWNDTRSRLKSRALTGCTRRGVTDQRLNPDRVSVSPCPRSPWLRVSSRSAAVRRRPCPLRLLHDLDARAGADAGRAGGDHRLQARRDRARRRRPSRPCRRRPRGA